MNITKEKYTAENALQTNLIVINLSNIVSVKSIRKDKFVFARNYLVLALKYYCNYTLFISGLFWQRQIIQIGIACANDTWKRIQNLLKRNVNKPKNAQHKPDGGAARGDSHTNNMCIGKLTLTRVSFHRNLFQLMILH